MLEKSDAYRWAVCRHCGVMAKYAPIYECMSCQSNDLALIETPYAFKLLTQELEAMGLQMRISDHPFVDSDDDTSDDESNAGLDENEQKEDEDIDEKDEEDSKEDTQEEDSQEGGSLKYDDDTMGEMLNYYGAKFPDENMVGPESMAPNSIQEAQHPEDPLCKVDGTICDVINHATDAPQESSVIQPTPTVTPPNPSTSAPALEHPLVDPSESFDITQGTPMPPINSPVKPLNQTSFANVQSPVVDSSSSLSSPEVKVIEISSTSGNREPRRMISEDMDDEYRDMDESFTDGDADYDKEFFAK
jgi:hypothetical protein